MKKRFYAALLALCLLLAACGCQAQTPDPSETLPPVPETAGVPETPSAAPESPVVEAKSVRLSEGGVPKLAPYDRLFNVLTENGTLDEETFDSFSAKEWIWEKELFDPADISTFQFESNMVFEGSEGLAEQILEAAKNPGLGVRALHEQGITGEGVNVAIIDQNLLLDHPEYAGCIAAYYDSGCEQPEDEGSMHAPGMLSLLSGQTVGVAPGAKVWFAAAPSWLMDAAYDADCLNWIIEQNRALPEGEEIRVVCNAAYLDGANTDQWAAAVAAAQAEGIMVLDLRSGEATGFICPSYGDAGDPDDVTKYQPGYPTIPWSADQTREDSLFVPSSLRTTAQEYAAGRYLYTYWGQSGVSWSIPYAAGVLALGWQVNPELDAETMKELLLQSAWVNEDGCRMIDPAAFIELVRAA